MSYIGTQAGALKTNNPQTLHPKLACYERSSSQTQLISTTDIPSEGFLIRNTLIIGYTVRPE